MKRSHREFLLRPPSRTRLASQIYTIIYILNAFGRHGKSAMDDTHSRSFSRLFRNSSDGKGKVQRVLGRDGIDRVPRPTKAAERAPAPWAR